MGVVEIQCMAGDSVDQRGVGDPQSIRCAEGSGLWLTTEQPALSPSRCLRRVPRRPRSPGQDGQAGIGCFRAVRRPVFDRPWCAKRNPAVSASRRKCDRRSPAGSEPCNLYNRNYFRITDSIERERSVTEERAVSRELAGFAAALRIDDLPADVVHQAVRCLVDWLGCTIAGAATAEGERVRAGIGALDAGDGSRTAAIIGTCQRAGVGYAALANGIAAHVLDFDDTFNPNRTTIHGSAPLWPAIVGCRATGPGFRRCRGRGVRRRIRSADPGRRLRGAGPLRRRLARDRHRRAHRGRSGDREPAAPLGRTDARRDRNRRDAGGGYEGGVRVDGQVAAPRQGGDGRAVVRHPRAARIHLQFRVHRGPPRIPASFRARPGAVAGDRRPRRLLVPAP